MGPYKPLLLGWSVYPLLYGNNGSLDPSTHGKSQGKKTHPSWFNSWPNLIPQTLGWSPSSLFEFGSRPWTHHPKKVTSRIARSSSFNCFCPPAAPFVAQRWLIIPGEEGIYMKCLMNSARDQWKEVTLAIIQVLSKLVNAGITRVFGVSLTSSQSKTPCKFAGAFHSHFTILLILILVMNYQVGGVEKPAKTQFFKHDSIKNWMGPYQQTPKEVAIELLDTQVFSGSVQWVRPWVRLLGMIGNTEPVDGRNPQSHQFYMCHGQKSLYWGWSSHL